MVDGQVQFLVESEWRFKVWSSQRLENKCSHGSLGALNLESLCWPG
jgi:hypothetical protein